VFIKETTARVQEYVAILPLFKSHTLESANLFNDMIQQRWKDYIAKNVDQPSINLFRQTPTK